MARNKLINYSYILSITSVCLLFYISSVFAQEDIDVPVSKLSQNVGKPTLKFLYCYSCGYKKMFDQYEQLINNKYRYILVDGANYDPPGIYMFLVRVIGTLKIVAILCLISGINVFQCLNMPQPSWYQWCLENKIYACMMLFFLCNLVEGQLISSGAFEIFLNDVPIWSKLESGRIPQPAELFQIIDSHMQFTDTKLELKGYAK
ncbi:thioredoxin reductase-like selenoprotein T homolog CG3887 [Anthonomus grandis grandis]|uniref:thioredoxin reductase-like selenoprotein T homolog CG3887 n=1 Tax=Anthonomus grandis grandis TaxID=2921223 RepID=UPI00216667EB|nr:thioredoxin reductase-like selenoprotein T homolog CG3887 [Anthonomus grandis grandis]